MIMLGKESENKLLSNADVRSAEMEQIGLLATDDHWLVCLHLVHLMPLYPQTPSSLPHLNPDFLVPAYPGCPGNEAVKRV